MRRVRIAGVEFPGYRATLRDYRTLRILDSRASVVIRYRTGDFVKGGITYETCPHCRRRVPRISSDITRLSDVKDLRFSRECGHPLSHGRFCQRRYYV